MHLAQLVLSQAPTHTGQVNRLASGHALVARSPGQQAHAGRLFRSADAGVLGGQHFKSQGLQSVTRQQGLRLAKLHMHCGFAAPQNIVVHAGHVVVHQRISVDQFDGTSGVKRRGAV